MVEGYTDGMLRYAITSGFDADLSEDLLANARRWAGQRVDFVQLREKHREAGDLIALARAMKQIFSINGSHARLLINSRADIAVVAGADGVHLTSRPGELTAEQVRRVFAASGAGEPVVSVSCHTVAEVQRAVAGRVDLILFGPVFEKRVAGEVVVAGVGLEALREACGIAGKTPVLALGGETQGN